MPRSRFFGFGRVNLIKKVKIDGEWKFCSAVVEQGKKLSDRVRVRGEIETHGEGTYYLEWRHRGKRLREPVRNRALVFEQARLKGLELEELRRPPELASLPESPFPAPKDPAVPSRPVVAHQFPALTTLRNLELPAAHLIWRGIESYLREIIATAVRSELANLGLTTPVAVPTSEPTRVTAIPAVRSHPQETKPGAPQPPDTGTSIRDAIDPISRTSSRRSANRKPMTNIAWCSTNFAIPAPSVISKKLTATICWSSGASSTPGATKPGPFLTAWALCCSS